MASSDDYTRGGRYGEIALIMILCAIFNSGSVFIHYLVRHGDWDNLMMLSLSFSAIYLLVDVLRSYNCRLMIAISLVFNVISILLHTAISRDAHANFKIGITIINVIYTIRYVIWIYKMYSKFVSKGKSPTTPEEKPQLNQQTEKTMIIRVDNDTISRAAPDTMPSQRTADQLSSSCPMVRVTYYDSRKKELLHRYVISIGNGTDADRWIDDGLYEVHLKPLGSEKDNHDI